MSNFDYIFRIIKKENENEISKIRSIYSTSYPKAGVGYSWYLTNRRERNRNIKVLSNVGNLVKHGHPLTRALNAFIKTNHKIKQLKTIIHYPTPIQEKITGQDIAYTFSDLGRKKLLDFSYINNLTLKSLVIPYIPPPKKGSNIRVINLLNFGSLNYKTHLSGKSLTLDFTGKFIPFKDKSVVKLENIIRKQDRLVWDSSISYELVDNYFLGGVPLRKVENPYGDVEIALATQGEQRQEFQGRKVGTKLEQFKEMWNNLTVIFPKLKKLKPNYGIADKMIFNSYLPRIGKNPDIYSLEDRDIYFKGGIIELDNVPYVEVGNTIFPLVLPIPRLTSGINFSPLVNTSIFNKQELSGRFLANRTYNRAISYKNMIYQKEINRLKGIYSEAYRNIKNKLMAVSLTNTIKKDLEKKIIEYSKFINQNKTITNPEQLKNFLEDFFKNIRKMRFEPGKYEAYIKEISSALNIPGDFKEYIDNLEKSLKELFELKDFEPTIYFEERLKDELYLINKFKEIRELEDNWWDFITDNINQEDLHKKLNRISKEYLGKNIEDDPEWQYLSEELTAKFSDALKELEHEITKRVKNFKIIKEFSGFQNFESILRAFSKIAQTYLKRNSYLYLNSRKSLLAKKFLLGFSAGYLMRLLYIQLSNFRHKALDTELIDLKNRYSLLVRNIFSEVYKTIYGSMIKTIDLAVRNTLMETTNMFVKKYGSLYKTTGQKIRKNIYPLTSSLYFKSKIRKGYKSFYIDLQEIVEDIIYVNVINVI